jgi:tRNA modification GTPase
LTTDTVFALSSGAPPAAIGVVRISGPHAGAALRALAGDLPPARQARVRTLRDGAGGELDRALVLWLPGPRTATGEDMAELHCHGGRAVIAAVEAALAQLPQLRRATAGEFTRRAFANGRIDLAEAEGLADLLAAETELQRQIAMASAGGRVSRQVEGWRDRVLSLAAQLEAVLDFADEGDVSLDETSFAGNLAALRTEMGDWLAAPRADTLREGFRVVLAGPPNYGKSTLFNVLVEDEAAITAPVAGTTRDIITRTVAIEGVPFVFADTAGLRSEPAETIEAIGIARAQRTIDAADLVLWLGPEGAGPSGSWDIEPQIDRADRPRKRTPRHRVSAVTGVGLAGLRADLVSHARQALPKPGAAAFNRRQHELLGAAHEALLEAAQDRDALVQSECLRRARVAFDRLLGRAATEDMLDALFGRFCIGK